MKQKRPVNLDLTTLSFPPMAIASILHRISGIILFLFFPGMLYLLSLSLASEQHFMQALNLLNHPVTKLLSWIVLASITYHLLAGIRHIVMDLGCGEGLSAGRKTAVLVISLAIILAICLGIWIW